MNRSQAQDLLSEFGKLAGIEDIELDEDGAGAIVIDNKIIISVGFNEIAKNLVFMATLDECEPNEAQMRKMLEANFLWRGAGGANFAIAPKADVIVLLYPVPVDTTAIELQLLFISFVEMVEDWQNRLVDNQGIPDQLSPAISNETSMIWG